MDNYEEFSVRGSDGLVRVYDGKGKHVDVLPLETTNEEVDVVIHYELPQHYHVVIANKKWIDNHK